MKVSNVLQGNSLEVMFWDLTPEAQKILLEFLGMSSPDEGNFSIVPVAVIQKPE